MRTSLMKLFLATFLLAYSTRAHSENNLLIPNQNVALNIATILIEAKYGKKLTEKHKPYSVVEDKNAYIITGDSKENDKGGGAPELKISKKNCEVLSIHLAR